MKAGDVFDENNIRRIRPGFGLQPRFFNELIGKHATKDIKRGTPLSWDHVD